MITKEIPLAIHEEQIAGYGGMPGVRDEGLLESALNRAYPTWGDEDLRPDPLEKAAALLEGIVGNHPFFDGNKRTGYAVARIQLLLQGLALQASQ